MIIIFDHHAIRHLLVCPGDDDGDGDGDDGDGDGYDNGDEKPLLLKVDIRLEH